MTSRRKGARTRRFAVPARNTGPRTNRKLAAMFFASPLRAAALLACVLLRMALPQQALAYTAYVTNEKGNSVSVIDTDKLATTTVPVGERPRGIALSPDSKELYVCASDDDTIQVIDTKTMQIVGNLESGADPELLIVSRNGKYVFTSNENDNLVTVIDVKTRRRIFDVPVGVEPEGMAISPDDKILVNTSETTDMAHMIDLRSRRVIANILVDARPRFAQYTPNAKELWVSSEVGGSVAVIDPVKHVVMQKIRFAIPGLADEAIQPVGINFTADGKTAFVALGPANHVAVIDTATKQVEKYLLVGQRVWHMAFTPDGKYLYTTNGVSNDVSVIDVADLKVIKSIPVGQLPWGVAIGK